MAKSRNRHIPDVCVGYAQFRLCFLQSAHLFSGQVTRAYWVLKASVRSWRENLIAHAELLEILESLKMRCVDDLPTKDKVKLHLELKPTKLDPLAQ